MRGVTRRRCRAGSTSSCTRTRVACTTITPSGQTGLSRRTRVMNLSSPCWSSRATCRPLGATTPSLRALPHAAATPRSRRMLRKIRARTASAFTEPRTAQDGPLLPPGRRSTVMIGRYAAGRESHSKSRCLWILCAPPELASPIPAEALALSEPRATPHRQIATHPPTPTPNPSHIRLGCKLLGLPPFPPPNEKEGGACTGDHTDDTDGTGEGAVPAPPAPQ